MIGKAYFFCKKTDNKKNSIAILFKSKENLIAHGVSPDNIAELKQALKDLISTFPKRYDYSNIIVSDESHLVAKADLIKLISQTQKKSKYKLEDCPQFDIQKYLSVNAAQLETLIKKYNEQVTCSRYNNLYQSIQSNH